MKKLIVIIGLLIIAGQVTAQSEGFFKADENNPLLITVGYVPKASYNAIKGTVSFNSFLFKRVGLYTSLEKGLDNDYMSNIIGGTFSINKYAYLFAGADIFTKYGLLENGLDCRKEFGIGLIPFSGFIFKTGWSKAVGITLEAGLRIPL